MLSYNFIVASGGYKRESDGVIAPPPWACVYHVIFIGLKADIFIFMILLNANNYT